MALTGPSFSGFQCSQCFSGSGRVKSNDNVTEALSFRQKIMLPGCPLLSLGLGRVLVSMDLNGRRAVRRSCVVGGGGGTRKERNIGQADISPFPLVGEDMIPQSRKVVHAPGPSPLRMMTLHPLLLIPEQEFG